MLASDVLWTHHGGRKLLRRALVLASTVIVRVANGPGAVVPVSLLKTGKTEWVFRFKHDGKNIPPDLCIDDDGIRATMSFRDGQFVVSIPWHCVLSVGYSADEAARSVIENN
jgi:hypothetical protein